MMGCHTPTRRSLNFINCNRANPLDPTLSPLNNACCAERHSANNVIRKLHEVCILTSIKMWIRFTSDVNILFLETISIRHHWCVFPACVTPWQSVHHKDQLDIYRSMTSGLDIDSCASRSSFCKSKNRPVSNECWSDICSPPCRADITVHN